MDTCTSVLVTVWQAKALHQTNPARLQRLLAAAAVGSGGIGHAQAYDRAADAGVHNAERPVVGENGSLVDRGSLLVTATANPLDALDALDGRVAARDEVDVPHMVA